LPVVKTIGVQTVVAGARGELEVSIFNIDHVFPIEDRIKRLEIRANGGRGGYGGNGGNGKDGSSGSTGEDGDDGGDGGEATSGAHGGKGGNIEI
jgi:hypothetical protein